MPRCFRVVTSSTHKGMDYVHQPHWHLDSWYGILCFMSNQWVFSVIGSVRLLCPLFKDILWLTVAVVGIGQLSRVKCCSSSLINETVIVVGQMTNIIDSITPTDDPTREDHHLRHWHFLDQWHLRTVYFKMVCLGFSWEFRAISWVVLVSAGFSNSTVEC